MGAQIPDSTQYKQQGFSSREEYYNHRMRLNTFVHCSTVYRDFLASGGEQPFVDQRAEEQANSSPASKRQDHMSKSFRRRRDSTVGQLNWSKKPLAAPEPAFRCGSVLLVCVLNGGCRWYHSESSGDEQEADPLEAQKEADKEELLSKRAQVGPLSSSSSS